MTGGQHIPRLHKETYLDKTMGYFFAFNPLSTKGVIILTDELYLLYSRVNNERTVEDIFKLLKKDAPYLSEKHFAYLISMLTRTELVYFGKPKLLEKMYSYKAPTFSVWLHITNQCNLRCTYCFVKKTNDRMDDKMLQDSITNLFISASKNKYDNVFIRFAGGEPLLELPHVIKGAELAVAASKKYGIHLEMEILTNGTLLTEKAIRLLEKAHVQISISIDGVDPSHDKNRPFQGGRSSYRYALNGLMRSKNSKMFKNVIVTITKHNVKKLPKLVEYFLQNNIQFYLQFFASNPETNQETVKQLQVNDDELIRYLHKAYAIVRKNLPSYMLFNGLIHTTHFRKPSVACPAADRSFMTIRHDGKLANCNWMLEKPVGSIYAKGDVIEEYKKNAFIHPVSSIKKKIKCFTCRWQHVCSGCPLEFYWNPNITEPPYCKTKMALIPEVLKLEAERIIRYSLHKKALS